MIKKLTIYLCGNFESYELRQVIEKCLKQKYHSVIQYDNDNYVMNALKICKEITKKSSNSIGLFFCNYGSNLSFAINNFNHINMSVITKNNRSQISSFINKNILIFSIEQLTLEDINKSIKLFLSLLQKNVIFY